MGVKVLLRRCGATKAGVECAICGKQAVRRLPIGAMATGTTSNVTPVVLRKDMRPPAYRDNYSEGASGTYYTTYTEYKKRVAHANAGGAIQREVGVDGRAYFESRAESFCSRVQ